MDSAAAASGYPDSVSSSPRSRGGESWDEPFAPSSAPKLRLMCSYGGRIVPRPTDKSLCYLGGETRIVVVDRLCSLADLLSRLSRLHPHLPFSLKYQLPNEDLDSLISLTSDEDLENMLDEYDRLLLSNPNPSRSSRIRLFLFPSKPPDSASPPSSIESETWFVDALNGADAVSVNSLLGLDDDSSKEAEQLLLRRQPDSPMLDTTSSFGSASSAPSLSNLPPIRVRPEDRPPDRRIGLLDDQFSQMNISAGNPPGTGSTPTISPSENPNRFFSDDERSEKSEQGGCIRRAPPPTYQQPKIDAPFLDSIPRPTYSPNPTMDGKREPPPPPSYQASEPSSLLPPFQPEHLAQHQHQHQHPHPHPQFIPANPHYVHHPATGTISPIQSYYQIPQQPPHFDPQVPMYYLPVRPTIPAATLQPAPPRAPIVHIAPDQGQPYAGIGYHILHHQTSQSAAALAGYGYEYAATADPSHPQMYYAAATATSSAAPPPLPSQVLQAQYQAVVQAQPGAPMDAKPS